ncbi:EamA domain-containing membrane protein RarD [Streptoalloteichus tenebrarius]|uniref:EamA domain-containing membrane protein RarD n=1 Tax=Streptoalloteichus tenebrarius (strain ATCC 17920 / DSM 40477 / JCM 4838 / CBS 697.72 / NBRC 16177 / NCIMB 11028 / NRRL B-12390 / A12253. 1 / ISP 5477) TaxID=1933 RepID=A0ABT1HN43_STRSD|nr:EamA domain-containing membrane protein RarD [Streptoalloteichus tenebrarius]
MSWWAWAALGVVYVVWGSTYLAIRFLVESAPPLLGASARFLVGGLVLALLVLLISGPRGMRMTKAQFGTAALVGVLLPAVGNGLVTVAEQYVASGLAALLVACVPLYVVVLRLALGERPSAVTVVGVAVGLGGLAVLVLGGGGEATGTHGSAWWAPWLVLLAAFGWSVGSVATTRLPVPPNPFALSAVEMIVGGLVLAVSGWARGERIDVGAISTSSWLAFAYLALVGSVFAFSAYVYVLGVLPVSTVSTYAYVNPVIAVLLGVVVADERFDTRQLVGGLLVVLAVVLVVSAERRRGRSRPAPEVSVEAGTITESCRR